MDVNNSPPAEEQQIKAEGKEKQQTVDFDPSRSK